MEGRGLKYRKNESTTFMDGPFAQYPPSMLLLLNGHRLMQAMMTLHSARCMHIVTFGPKMVALQ